MAVHLSHRISKSGSVPTRPMILIALALQNAALVLLLRYSRTMPLINGQRYFPSTAILLSEVFKLPIFLSLSLFEITSSSRHPNASTISELANQVAKAAFTGDSWKLAIPAILYTVQNTLQYLAVDNLSAATFSATFQLKILATALCSALILGRRLSPRRWFSLGLLTAGVLLVQLSTIPQQASVLSIADLKTSVTFHSRSSRNLHSVVDGGLSSLLRRSATYEGINKDHNTAHPIINESTGIAAATFACCLSGFASVALESSLSGKGDASVSIWVRNLQLSFYSVWPALFLGVFFQDGEYISKTGFFAGYNWAVWAVVVLQTLGGILVALTHRYADNSSKSCTASVAAALVSGADVCFFGFRATNLFLAGFSSSLFAAYIFGTAPTDRNYGHPPITVSQFEKNTEPAGISDSGSVISRARSPLREMAGEGLSTSRPGTPVSERRQMRSKSQDKRW